MNKLISVVICTHNRSVYLAKAIQSLQAQTLAVEKFEVIAVDNCSTDRTKEVVEQFSKQLDIRYVYEPMLGLSYARNTGWRSASTPYIAYLDDDAIACPVWLEKIFEVFETVTPRPGCVGGKAMPIWEASRPEWLSDQLVTSLTVIDWSDTPHTIADLSQQWLVGANIAFPKEVLEQVGGFAAGLDRAGKNLLSGGDVFLEKQIIQAGYSCFYHPEVTVHHHIQSSRLTKPWFVRRYYWQGMSDAMVQLIEESPAATGRLRLAIFRMMQLVLSSKKLSALLLPTSDPKRFTDKCFTLIEVGHIVGLLGAVNQ